MASKKKANTPEPRPRHRAGTEQSLVKAVGQVLSERGLSGVSASNVAAQAGVDKALIYRYFGSFDALLESYASSPDYWPSVEEIIVDRRALLELPFLERFSLVMRRYARALRARPATIAVLAAELTDRVALHPRLTQQREEFGLALLELTHDAPVDFDSAAMATVLTGAVHYLLIRAGQVEAFNGIALASDEGWARIEVAMDVLIRLQLQPAKDLA